MADVVQYKLERMVNELDDLERRGLFNRREIAEIVKQRRKFEYRLKRPSPLKQDFMAYIDYEKQLDALRLLRRKAMARDLKEKGNKKLKKSVSDFARASRIIEIYRLATNRFKGDIQFWFQYLEFCRERRNGRMKKALAQVLRFHPKVPSVWIYAAAWEFDHNLNAAAARAIMQSGLRACPNSEDLWIEYVRMELTYLNKLKARKVALGEDEGASTHDNKEVVDKQWEEENKELFMALDEKVEVDVHDKKVELFREHGQNILRTVYSGAIEALPSSFNLRKRFIEIVEGTDLTNSEEMKREMLSDMKRDFSKEPEYWDWLARLEIDDPSRINEASDDQIAKAIEVYEEAIKVAPSDNIFSFYTKFMMNSIFDKDKETSDHSTDRVSHVLTVYEKAESMSFINEDLACEHVSFLMKLGREDEARMVANRLCLGKLSKAVSLWGLWLSIEMRLVGEKTNNSPSKSDLLPIYELLRNVLREVSVSDAESLWLMALKFFASHKYYLKKLVEMSIVLLAEAGGSDDGFSLSSTIVNLILEKDGIQRARETYKRFLALPHPGLVLYRNCIEIESNLAFAGDKDCLIKARKLYESALATYDQDESLWQDYYSLEIKMGTSETAGAVHWRARKTLKNNVLLLAPTDL